MTSYGRQGRRYQYGFPAVADTDIPVIHPTGVSYMKRSTRNLTTSKIVQKAIEVRGLKIVVENRYPCCIRAAFEARGSGKKTCSSSRGPEDPCL